MEGKNIIGGIIVLSFIGWGVKKCTNTVSAEKKEKTEANKSVNENKPLDPDVKTDFGQIGNYKTMDQYYINNNGSKVWHGYRKNLYPSGMPKIVSSYEYGKLMWTEKYDEVGNVTSSDRK